MAWLSDWAKRRKITIDSAKIDSDLTHFPVPVFLGTSVGQSAQDVSDIFDEVGSNWQKIAVTDSTGDTQVYVEVEQWEATNEVAVLWVSRSDLTLSSSSDPELYIYYDNSKSDNTSYVDQPGNRSEVWDSNFLLVHHFSSTDEFENETWTKDSANPVIGTGYGEPSIYYEGGTYYLFISDRATWNIDLFTATDPFGPFTDQGAVVTISDVPEASNVVSDPCIIWNRSVYRLYFQSDNDTIHYAESSSIDSGWTYQGVCFSASDLGLSTINEPTLVYEADAPTDYKYKMLYNDGGANPQYIRYAHSENGTTSWVDEGSVLSGSEHIEDPCLIKHNGLYYQYVNVDSGVDGVSDDNAVAKYISSDCLSWLFCGVAIPTGSSGDFDSNAPYAPTLVEVDGTWHCFYQGNDGSNNVIGHATASQITVDSPIDSTGNSKWGSRYNTSASDLIDGIINKAVQFTTSTDDRLEFGQCDELEGLSNFSVGMNLKINSQHAGTLFSKNANDGIHIQPWSDGNIYFAITDTNNRSVAPYSADGVFRRWVFDYDGSTLRIYSSGSQVASASKSTSVASDAKEVKLGGEPDESKGFDGAVGELRISLIKRSDAWINLDNESQQDNLVTFSSPQTVTVTDSPTNIASTSATLNGTLESLEGNSSLDVYFEYGTDTSYGTTTASQTISSVPTSFSADIFGLTKFTEYHYRAVATDGTNYWYGKDVSFFTADLRDVDETQSEFQNGTLTDVEADGGGYLRLADDSSGNYLTSGNRTVQLDLSSLSTYSDSLIEWTATLNGQSLTIETRYSLDGGSSWSSWQTCTSGDPIPGLSSGDDLSNGLLECKQTLSTNDVTTSPELSKLGIYLIETSNIEFILPIIKTETQFILTDISANIIFDLPTIKHENKFTISAIEMGYPNIICTVNPLNIHTVLGININNIFRILNTQ